MILSIQDTEIIKKKWQNLEGRLRLNNKDFKANIRFEMTMESLQYRSPITIAITLLFSEWADITQLSLDVFKIKYINNLIIFKF